MAYINDVEIRGDVEIEVDEFFSGCSYLEKQQLRDIIIEHFEMRFLSTSQPLVDGVIDALGDAAEGIEAKDFVRRVIEEMQYKLKMRTFSLLVVK